MSSAQLDYTRVSTPNPHLDRAKKIMAAHPEVKSLFGNYPTSALYILGIVAIQVTLAIALRNQPVWLCLISAYLIGAVVNHGAWVMIHECGHNLVFKSTTANNWMNIIANLPIIFPSAISFKKYHAWHHRYQGELSGDADLAAQGEADLIGDSPLRKALWLLFFFIFEGVVRPMRIKGVKLWCRWTLINTVVEIGFLAAVTYVFGWKAFLYLALSTLFSIGLHPVGGRWIQEHYLFPNMGALPGQETFSYYGPLNNINFNIGYHNEHHDLMMVPWSRLKKLHQMAPEFYSPLAFHTSYTRLILRFIFDRNVTLYSRVVRNDRATNTRSKPETIMAGMSTASASSELALR